MTVRYNIIGYLVGEGFRNIFKNKKSTSASLIIMCFTMLIFGVFFMIGENVNSIMKQIEGAQGIQIFLKDGTTDEEIKEIGEKINSLDAVHGIEFRSKEDAINQVKSKFSDKAYLLDGYEQALPVSYVVTLTDLNLSEQVQEQMKEIAGDHLKEIRSKDDTVTALLSLANGIKIITGVILIFLIIISIFIISNTIKLTVHARRKEISIMKYVGATNSFIRWPFIVEGIIIGVLAAALSILVIGVLYNVIAHQIVASPVMIKMGISLLTFSDMFNSLIIVYMILGIGIGILGSSISMRKYLKV